MSRRLAKRVRIIKAFEGREVGEEYTVECEVWAAGHIFYGICEKPGCETDLLHGSKCEVIEYHEST